MSTTRSFKAAITTRVNTEQASKLFNESRQMGNPMTCPGSAINIDVDEFSRPLGGAGYRMAYLNDPSCSSFVYPVGRKIRHENSERPILGPCNPGDRGAGDFLYGSVRDRYPENIYGHGTRGNFVKSHGTVEEGYPTYATNYSSSAARPLTISHDALTRPFFK
uniref:Uncharacterized protein n=1 Tax=viral metagenome TaxID=1070528 RepID=A0A6C0JQY2_9ZZZZ